MENRLINFENVEPLLKTKRIGRSYGYYDSIDSTNLKCKIEANEEVIDGRVNVAEEQTMGRGRQGRTWETPKYSTIALSITLKPDIEVYRAPKITVVAAAAIYRTLKSIGLNVGIKWPNDIVINGKKVCGILTEMSTNGTTINYVVMGIGINVNMIEFPEELSDKATSIRNELGYEYGRAEIIASFLNDFEELYDTFNNGGNMSEVMNVCREGSVLIGKQVRIIDGNQESICEVININDEGELVVKLEDGEIKNILSGEVSVRGIYGYI